MSHLKNTDLYCYRRLNTADAVLLLHSNQRLNWVWFLALSYIQGKYDLFPLFVSLFKTFYRDNFPHNSSCWLPTSFSFSLTLKHPLAFNFHSCSIPFFLVFMQTTVFVSGTPSILETSALPLNRTIIYLCMYNENEFTLLISSWNKHSKRLH